MIRVLLPIVGGFIGSMVTIAAASWYQRSRARRWIKKPATVERVVQQIHGARHVEVVSPK